MTQSTGTKKHSDTLRVWCARVAMICFATAFLATIVASLIVPDVNMIADTISDAAAGKYDIIQDAGLSALAIGLWALAYGMRGIDLDSTSWIFSSWLLVVMGGAVTVMAYWEGYSPGHSYLTIHSYVVYVYGGAFIAVLWLVSFDLVSHDIAWPWINISLSICWAALATFFFLMGTEWDGLVERILALIQMIWLYLFACKVEHEGGATHLPYWLTPRFVSRTDTRKR